MFHLIDNKINHSNQVHWSKKYTCHSSHEPLTKMSIFISQCGQGNQLEQVKKTMNCNNDIYTMIIFA